VWGELAPLHPRLLHHWSHSILSRVSQTSWVWNSSPSHRICESKTNPSHSQSSFRQAESHLSRVIIYCRVMSSLSFLLWSHFDPLLADTEDECRGFGIIQLIFWTFPKISGNVSSANGSKGQKRSLFPKYLDKLLSEFSIKVTEVRSSHFLSKSRVTSSNT